MKTLDEIWQIYLDRDLNPEELKDLVWHIENDEDPQGAISITADMGLKNLGNVLAKHLKHPKPFIRELTIGCLLGQLELPEYAEKGLEMSKNETQRVRNIAIFSLGAIIDKVLFSLAQKIAKYILSVFQDSDEDKSLRDSAYFSILKGMEVPRKDRPLVSKEIQDSDIDQSIVYEFCKKYQVTLPEKKGSHLPREENTMNSHPAHNQRFH